ncbi:MAG TPA: hypothetical protein VGN83_16080 [Falsiroseomonas sp.]|jgi:hypothetical protein|nr:hypothetical protein [Falsiroseomonas sp.]
MADGMQHDTFAPLDGASHPPPCSSGGDAWVPILPAPHPLPQTIRHRRHGVPSTVWHYRDAAGALLFAVCRFDTSDGGKEVLPLTCGRGGWRWKGPPKPYPLYGLDRLAARPTAPALVVEGEKATDAAAKLFPDFVPVCWPGGSNVVAKADWTALRGRLVAVWPDADAPGRKAAAEVAKAATAARAASVAVVSVPQDWPEGWDVADFGAHDRPQPAATTVDSLRAMLSIPMVKSVPESPGDALRGDVKLAAEMNRADYLTARLDMARLHRIPVAELDAMRAEARRDAMAAEVAEPQEAPIDPRGRADLLVDNADLPDTAAALADMLAAVPNLFDRGGPARLARDRTRDAYVVEPLTINGVVNEAHRIARPWMETKIRGEIERKDITLPDRVAKLYLDDRAGWGLRPLDGITSAPLLHDDGTVRAAEGYDDVTRLWCERVPAVDVPAAPSQDDAAAALLRLRLHFRTFAFADAKRVQAAGTSEPVVDTAAPAGADESAFLCALLTAVCRPCLWLAPGLLVRAPEYSGAGTGKGLLVRSICAIAYGSRPVAVTAGGTPEEFDKRIGTALMEAGAALFLDNLNATALKSDVLASAITERPAAVRVLGRSALVILNPSAFVAVTGNGLALSEDMARRFLTVELDAGIEDPKARDFRADFQAETMAARVTLLADVLTIWRWGRQAGDALPAGRAMGSFPGWARWCRDPLVALGCRDPALRVADAKAKDPRRQAVAEIFTAWWEAHQDQPVPVAELADLVRQAADPMGRGRQYLAVRVRALDGTRAAGFVLSRSFSVGKWSGDLYRLQRSEAGRPTEAAPMPPMTPMPSGSDSHTSDDGACVWSEDL